MEGGAPGACEVRGCGGLAAALDNELGIAKGAVDMVGLGALMAAEVESCASFCVSTSVYAADMVASNFLPSAVREETKDTTFLERSSTMSFSSL